MAYLAVCTVVSGNFFPVAGKLVLVDYCRCGDCIRRCTFFKSPAEQKKMVWQEYGGNVTIPVFADYACNDFSAHSTGGILGGGTEAGSIFG